MKKTAKTLLTKWKPGGNINELSPRTERKQMEMKKTWKSDEKSSWQSGNKVINYESCRKTENHDNWTVKHIPRKFFNH